MENLIKILLKIVSVLFFCLLLNSCGGGLKLPKPGDARTMEIEGEARARKNVEEGRGWSLKNIGEGRKTTYEFSTSNPLWRATFDVIDFMPLVTVDYSGGMIISDWYTDNSNNKQALKITVRFLSNKVQTNSVKVTVHRKQCSVNESCKVEVFKSRIQEELVASILKEASLLEKQQKNN